MKRLLTLLGISVLGVSLLGLAYLTYSSRPSASDPIQAGRIFEAANAYRAQLAAEGRSVPASVSLDELIKRGLLAPGDVPGLAGRDVTVSLAATERRPQDVVARIRLADGTEIVALADGSVHQR